MAKKLVKSEDSKNTYDVGQLNSFLTKDVNKIGSLIEDNSHIGTKEYISTGIHVLDALLSAHINGGGIPNNRLIGIGGTSGSGKTFLCLNIARQAQKQGYFVIYIDSEGAIDPDLCRNFGIDTKMFRIDPLATVEDFKVYMAKFLEKLQSVVDDGKTLPKILIVLDSLGNLASAKEVADAQSGENKADMTRAKQLKSIFRIITHKLGVLGIPMILTNHTYLTQEMYPKEIFSGGTGAIYNASVILMLSKAKLKDDNMDDQDMQSGIIVTAKTEKNRLAKPKKVKFELSFVSGANPYKGLEFWCTPENFGKIGIAKGKKTVDEQTGEITVTPTGHNWYVSHLDKHVPFKNLHTAEVFTQDVLNSLDSILNDYFKYKSMEELEALNNKIADLRAKVDAGEEVGFQIDADDISSEKLFG